MKTGRHRRGGCRLASLALGPLLLLAGCGGGSRESGTQVEVSEEAKAQIAARRELYKARNMEKAKAKASQKSKSNPKR